MTSLKMPLAFVVACFMSSVLKPDVSVAETNRGEVQQRIEEEGGKYYWGTHLDHVQYAVAGAAIASGAGNAYVQAAVVEPLRMIGIQITSDQLSRLLKGETLTINSRTLTGGLATYNHWEVVRYNAFVPRWRNGWVKLETVQHEDRVPLPNTFQPYIRVR
jgi:hypothetical protein